METNGQVAPDPVPRWETIEYPPGFRRLRFGGFMLALASSLTVGSILLAILGIGALDFALFGLRIDSYPEPFVLDGLALAPLVALISLGPLAVLGIIGGGRLWLGWATPRLALITCVAWIPIGVVLVVADGSLGLLGFATFMLALIGSGAWAGRRPGSNLADMFLRGE